MSMSITPPGNTLELAASADVSKTIALYALMIALGSGGGAPQAVFEGVKQHLLQVFSGATVNLPAEEAAKYRAYAEATIEELFSRMMVNGSPMRNLAS